MSTPRVVLLIGNSKLLHSLDGAPDLGPGDIITLVTLLDTRPPEPGDNTVMVSAADLNDVHVDTRTLDGRRRLERRLTGQSADVLSGLLLGDQVAEMINTCIAALGGVGQNAARPVEAATMHAPLFCGVLHVDGWHVYGRTHVQPGRWCFIRLGSDPVPLVAKPGEDANWVLAAINAFAASASALNSHHTYRLDEFAGKEIEVKYTLPIETDIWVLAADCHAQIASGVIPWIVPHFTEEFETREYDSHLFWVAEPPESRGYISFMTIEAQRYRIKTKTYEHDSLVRGEHVTDELRIEVDLDAYVRDVMHTRARPLPAFRRYRYDVNIESLTTGHKYCILFDRCAVLGQPGLQLVQAEIEYINTRSVLPAGHQSVLQELETIVTWCGDYLRAHGLDATRGYYSKLSWLLDNQVAIATVAGTRAEAEPEAHFESNDLMVGPSVALRRPLN